MNKDLISQELQKLTRQPLLCDASMRNYTTWKIGGPADWLATPEREEELAALLTFCRENGLPCLVIGNGSNLLVGDKGIRGLVIHMGESFSHLDWNGEEVAAPAGMLLAALALTAAECGMGGLEFARGIPGSVGGGVRMNAGAYGGNLGPLVSKVEAVSYAGKYLELTGEALSFAYRNSSLFQLDAIVSRVHFKLHERDKTEIADLMREYQRRRSNAQPLEYPSCGSVFRNPPGEHAGHLVDQAGLKGLRCGDVEVSKKHGNFIINLGHGTAADVREVISLVQKGIMDKYGYWLEPEVCFVGEF